MTDFPISLESFHTSVCHNKLLEFMGPAKGYAVFSILELGHNTLCVTNEILEEYSEILSCLFNQQFADMVILAILKNPFVELFSPHYRFNLITADPDDNKFVDCAIVANARYIVTNDHHYNVLRKIKFPSVDVMNLTDFLDLLRNSSF